MDIKTNHNAKEEKIFEYDRVKQQDDKDLPKHWSNRVKVDPNFEDWRPKLIETLTPYADMYGVNKETTNRTNIVRQTYRPE